jgi:DNA-binding transcriptional LysR family regulator
MELNQLRAFRIAARHQHMTRAAEELHITQPAMSRMIARLEEELGAQLFDREGKTVSLNEYGRAVLEHSNRIFGEIEAMERHLRDLQGSVSGQIRIANSFPSREPDWLHDAIRSFLFEYSDVSFRIRQMSPHEIRQALDEREIDLALTVESVRSESIHWTRLFSERMGVIMAKEHPLCKKKTLHVSDLSSERFLCNNSNSDVYDLTRSFCALAGFEPYIYYEGDSPQLIGEAISRGLGVSFIASSRFADERRTSVASWEDNVVFHEIADQFCERTYGVAYAEQKYEPRAVQMFRSYLLEHAR